MQLTSSLFNDLTIDRMFCVESLPPIVTVPKTIPSTIRSRRITMPAMVEDQQDLLKLSATPNTLKPLFSAWNLARQLLPLLCSEGTIELNICLNTEELLSDFPFLLRPRPRLQLVRSSKYTVFSLRFAKPRHVTGHIDFAAGKEDFLMNYSYCRGRVPSLLLLTPCLLRWAHHE